MTSLIDVIFLLLLFFMLTSTFTRFSELRFSAAGSGAVLATQADAPPLFLRLGSEEVNLNGDTMPLDALHDATRARMEGPTTLLVSLEDDVTSQRLVDLLVILGTSADLSITVLN